MAEDELITTDAPKQKPPTKARKQLSKTSLVLIVAVLILGVAAGAYWYRDKQANKQAQQLQNEINKLNQEVSEAKKQVEELKKADTSVSSTPTASVPSQALVDNIKAVFASGNSAALEGYMANPTNVIIAASEGIGNQTPTEATKDVDNFMKNATDPWNFSLPAATVAAWQKGFYKQYFPSNAVVGKSDNMVIAFSFNNANKISVVFMTNNVDVLTQ